MADPDPVALVRRTVVDVDPEDGEGVRQWIAEQVRNEVLARGSARPRIVLSGTAVVRLAGRAWEVWILDAEMPAPLDDMIRWFASQAPPADGIGFAQLTVKSDDGAPVIQIIAERAGKQARVWAPLLFPNGPGTLPEADPQMRLQVRDATPDHGWLGVAPRASLAPEAGGRYAAIEGCRCAFPIAVKRRGCRSLLLAGRSRWSTSRSRSRASRPRACSSSSRSRPAWLEEWGRSSSGADCGPCSVPQW